MENNKKPIKTVAGAEADLVSRKLLVWLNKFPDKPDGVDYIRFEYLPAAAPAMALSSIQAAYVTREYILGGYEAEYQFKLIYRLNAGTSNDMRLKADELLNALGDWAADRCRTLDIGEGKRVRRIECASRASVFAAYDNGEEDHQILMKMIYEVNV